MSSKRRSAIVWLALVVAFLALFQLVSTTPRPHAEYAQFLADQESGRIASVRVQDNQLHVDRFDGAAYTTLGVMDPTLTRQLSEAGVIVQWGEEDDSLRTILIVALPILLLLLGLVFFLKKASGNQMSALQLVKSRARLISDASKVTFADVGGCEEAKAQLGDLIDFLKNPERWRAAGARLPRGVLLEGPPGCGKTLLARAVAGETEAKFYLVSASEFVELFVGVGAGRVRDMFETAAKEPPAVIFIDELDALGRRRGSGVGAGHDEREQTLNQLLVSLDGFEPNDRVVVIGATNRPDVLDAALMRPGRFDRRVNIPCLDRAQREHVLGIHTRNKKLAEDVDLVALAARTEGWSGADLEGLANEATLLAVRRARQQDAEATVSGEDFERALVRPEQTQLRFDHVDSLLVESTSQLSRPGGTAQVRLTLQDGSQVEGRAVWADAAFVKVDRGEAGETIVPKFQIRTLEALPGTELADDVAPDAWAGRMPSTG